MGHQAEYLARRNLVPRRQITTHLSTLFVFLVVSYVAVWYFWPTTDLANLPYCVGDLFSKNSPASERSNSLEGVYISPRSGPMFELSDPRWAHLLRFSADGRVMYAMEWYEDSLNWRRVSKWFIWDTTDGGMFIGKYDITNEQIHITLNRLSDGHAAEWKGMIVDGELKFESNDQLITNPFVGTNIVVFKPYNVEQCPFNKK